LGTVVAVFFVAAATSGSNNLFGGTDLLRLLVLALGGALVVGNALALLRPPVHTKQGQLARPPAGRSIVMIVIGLVAVVWAIASLTA
jgi:hypothetical protein